MVICDMGAPRSDKQPRVDALRRAGHVEERREDHVMENSVARLRSLSNDNRRAAVLLTSDYDVARNRRTESRERKTDKSCHPSSTLRPSYSAPRQGKRMSGASGCSRPARPSAYAEKLREKPPPG